MAEKRNIRRDAERKAREALSGDLVTTVGDLAVAVAERVDTAASLEHAHQRGEQILATAKEQADTIAADAQKAVDALEQTYNEKYAAARTAGWSTTQLTALGYTRPTGRRGSTNKAEPPEATPDATPHATPDAVAAS